MSDEVTFRDAELNFYDPSQKISYRFDTDRCTHISVYDKMLIGSVTGKVVYCVALPLGEWELVDEDKYHRVTLKRIG